MDNLPGATYVDTTITGEGVIDDGVAVNRIERVMATYHATLKTLWRRGYR